MGSAIGCAGPGTGRQRDRRRAAPPGQASADAARITRHSSLSWISAQVGGRPDSCRLALMTGTPSPRRSTGFVTARGPGMVLVGPAPVRFGLLHGSAVRSVAFDLEHRELDDAGVRQAEAVGVEAGVDVGDVHPELIPRTQGERGNRADGFIIINSVSLSLTGIRPRHRFLRVLRLLRGPALGHGVRHQAHEVKVRCLQPPGQARPGLEPSQPAFQPKPGSVSRRSSHGDAELPALCESPHQIPC